MTKKKENLTNLDLEEKRAFEQTFNGILENIESLIQKSLKYSLFKNDKKIMFVYILLKNLQITSLLYTKVNLENYFQKNFLNLLKKN